VHEAEEQNDEIGNGVQVELHDDNGDGAGDDFGDLFSFAHLNL